MKTCSKCKVIKSKEDFYFKNKRLGKLQSVCKCCQSNLTKNHYSENKQLYIDKAKAFYIKEKIRFYNWLKTKSCQDCGNDDFRVLEFDHLENKEFNIGDKVGQMAFESLLKEIIKCEIVCSNCHKIRTAIRGNFFAYLI